jgi:hypothetical protein
VIGLVSGQWYGTLRPMCAAYELNNRVLRPGKLVSLWRDGQPATLVWAGFARRESLGWWRKKGAHLVDVPAERFAERADDDGQLRWDAVPPGLVIRGLVDPHEGKPLLKVVTRASTPEEVARFRHDRMPLLELPLFSAGPPGIEDTVADSQRELW